MPGKLNSDVPEEVTGKAGFDQAAKTGPPKMVASDFAFGPSLLNRVTAPKPSFPALFVVLEKGESFVDLLGVFTAKGALLENKKSLVASDKRFFELNEGSVANLTLYLLILAIESKKAFLLLFETK